MNLSAIPLPNSWSKRIRSAVLHVISLAQYAVVRTRSWAADSPNARIRLTAENEQLRQEVALLRQEIRIKDARLDCIRPHRRPFCFAERVEGINHLPVQKPEDAGVDGNREI